MQEFGHYLSYNALVDLKKDLRIEKNILNRNQLKIIKDYGCRILVLSSNMYDPNGDLLMEKDFGEVMSVNMLDLYNYLKPKEEQAKFNVEVVFINVINGEKIAQVFKKLGVV